MSTKPAFAFSGLCASSCERRRRRFGVDCTGIDCADGDSEGILYPEILQLSRGLELVPGARHLRAELVVTARRVILL